MYRVYIKCHNCKDKTYTSYTYNKTLICPKCFINRFEFDESKHPRDESGKFGFSNSSSSDKKILDLYHGDRKSKTLYKVKLSVKSSEIIDAEDVLGAHDNPQAVLNSLKDSNVFTDKEFENLRNDIPNVANKKADVIYEDQDKYLKKLRNSLIDKGYKVIRYKNKWEGAGTYSYAILDKNVIETDKEILPSQNDIAILHIGSKQSAKEVMK